MPRLLFYLLFFCSVIAGAGSATAQDDAAAAAAAAADAEEETTRQVTRQNELEERFLLLERRIYDENALALRRLEHVETAIDSSQQHVDRLLLILALAVLTIFLFINRNLRAQQKIVEGQIRHTVRDADNLMRDIRRILERPEMEHLRISHILRRLMRQLRENNQAMSLAGHIEEVRLASADPYLPVSLYLIARVLVAEYDDNWNIAAQMLEQLREMDAKDLDVLLHLSHVHKNIAARSLGDKQARTRHQRLAYQYYGQFNAAMQAEGLAAETSAPPPAITPPAPQPAPAAAPTPPSSAAIPAPTSASSTPTPAASASASAPQTAARPAATPIPSSPVAATPVAPQSVSATPAPPSSAAIPAPVSASPAPTPATVSAPTSAPVTQTAARPAAAPIPSPPAAATPVAPQSASAAPAAPSHPPVPTAPAAAKTRAVPATPAATATVTAKPAHKPTTAVAKTTVQQPRLKAALATLKQKRDKGETLTNLRQNAAKWSSGAAKLSAKTWSELRTLFGEKEDADMPFLPVPSISEIPEQADKNSRQMWGEIRQGDLTMTKATNAKSIRERNRLIDEALIFYTQAQAYSSNETLYHNWGLALLAKALHVPEKKRAPLYNAAVDKFLAGNVITPHYFDFHLASLYAIIGDKKECLKWLTISRDHGTLDLQSLRQMPDFDAMRNEPWFDEFLAA